MSCDSATAALLRAYARQRPQRVGSLILTVFGDAIAPRGGAVTLSSLIRMLEEFSITARLVRTSVGRLAEDGWLTGKRSGRRSEYHLSESGNLRFAEATERIYSGPPLGGGERWTLVLLPPASRGTREHLRSALRLGGYGEINEGVYAHPAVSAAETMTYLQDHGITAPLIFESALVGDTAPADLVRRAFDLSTLGQRYRQFCRLFTPVADSLQQGSEPTPAQAFAIRTLLVHEYRRIHLRDPRVPAALLPPQYPGHAAYALCRAVYHRTLTAAETYLQQTAERFDGALPSPAPSLFERFPATDDL